LNEVTWDLRTTPPKTATGGSKPDNGGFIAPMVLPGDYTIKLYVGDKEYSEMVTLVNDDKGKMTLDDRKTQYDAAMKCYSMHENLAKLADTINHTIDIVKAAADKDPKNKKLAVFLDSLKAFKGTLMATKQTSVFADEERLREKITKAYAGVCYQEARPTNLQTQNIDFLSGELEKSVKKGNDLLMQYQAKWKSTFKG
ncbi:MAG TPA: hypothetical protein VNZ45_06915, partial [Bacteroidia bacterium]|nr:hypothetical protein [Bacteroidia bacterium]